MTTTVKISSLLSLFAITLLSTAASADTFSGTTCNADNANPSAGYNFFGIRNGGSAALDVSCPAVTRGAVHSVSVTGYDRSPTDDLRCQIAMINSGGQIVFSANVSTTGFATAPITATASVPSINAGLVLRCSIPAANAQNGQSHVTSYTVL